MRTHARAGWRRAAQILIPAAALLIGRASMADDTRLPKPSVDNGIAYVSGGDDYRAAKTFEKSLDTYPLAIELLEKAGPASAKANHVVNEFTADAKVQIMDKAGKTVFAAESQGPFMLVKLPPGHYRMTATLGGRTLHKSDLAVVKGETARATFIFPRGTA